MDSNSTDTAEKVIDIVEFSEQTAPPQIQWGQLRRLMEFQELSYPALAKLSGTPESTLRKLLQGVTKDPRISTMLPVVRALGASFDRLLGLAPKRDFEREEASYDVTIMDSLRHQLEALKKQDAANACELDRLRKLVLAKGEAQSRAEERVAAQEALTRERESMVVEHAQKIAELNRKIEQQGERLEFKAQKIQDQSTEIGALKATIDAREKTIANLESMYRKRGDECRWSKIAIAVLGGLLILVVIYGAWEFINLDKGLTAMRLHT